MGKTRLGFDLGSSSMKIAVLRDNRVVRLEEVRLPENMVDEGGQYCAAPCLCSVFEADKKRAVAAPGPGGPGSAPQPGDLPAGEYAQNDHGPVADEPAL